MHALDDKSLDLPIGFTHPVAGSWFLYEGNPLHESEETAELRDAASK